MLGSYAKNSWFRFRIDLSAREILYGSRNIMWCKRRSGGVWSKYYAKADGAIREDGTRVICGAKCKVAPRSFGDPIWTKKMLMRQ